MFARALSPAVQMGLSVALATGLYAISFGALSVAAGLTILQTQALSLLMFTGGSQFAFVGVIAGQGAGSTATIAASLLGVRNAVYGIWANANLRPKGWLRLASAQVTIDESVAVGSAQTDPSERKRGFWTAGVGIFVLWNLFTLLGSLLGSRVGDTSAWGLDGAAVAAFLGLLWPRLKGREPIAIAIVAALITAVAIPFLPAGIPILAAALVAVAYAFAIPKPNATESKSAEPPATGSRATGSKAAERPDAENAPGKVG